MRIFRWAIPASVCVALALAGCGGQSSGGSTNTSGAMSAGAQSSAFPVTIKSSVGTATIPKQPKRVVAIGWGSQDAALALGVKPVGMQDMSGNTGDKTGVLPWDRAKLGGANPTLINYVSDSVPYEKIAALRPDVILAVNSGLTSSEWSQLNHIAPTVGYPGQPWLTSWQDQIGIVGKALGRTGEAAKLTKSTNALIAKARADHPEFRGRTVAFGSGTATDSYNIYLASDSRVQLLKQFGFTISPSVPTKGSSFAQQLSLERLNTIKSDVLVSWYLSSGTQKSLESSPLFKDMPAVQRHGYVAITDPAMVFATSSVTVLSLPWMLDRYLPLLSKAANGKASS
jgi:iron complex transport system substrate-binding protein